MPVRANLDDRYFTNSFQAMPAEGYTALFMRTLDHPTITVATGGDFRVAPGNGLEALRAPAIEALRSVESRWRVAVPRERVSQAAYQATLRSACL